MDTFIFTKLILFYGDCLHCILPERVLTATLYLQLSKSYPEDNSGAQWRSSNQLYCYTLNKHPKGVRGCSINNAFSNAPATLLA